jgi:hypothetical protein
MKHLLQQVLEHGKASTGLNLAAVEAVKKMVPLLPPNPTMRRA